MNSPRNTPFALEYAFYLLGDVRDKVVLDLGCEGVKVVLRKRPDRASSHGGELLTRGGKLKLDELLVRARSGRRHTSCTERSGAPGSSSPRRHRFLLRPFSCWATNGLRRSSEAVRVRAIAFLSM